MLAPMMMSTPLVIYVDGHGYMMLYLCLLMLYLWTSNNRNTNQTFCNRSTHIHTSWNSVTLGVPKFWYIFDPFCCAMNVFLEWLSLNLDRLLVLTGERGTKYIVHLFKILSSTWTYIWCHRVHNSNWHMVSWLCSCWTPPWTGIPLHTTLEEFQEN